MNENNQDSERLFDEAEYQLLRDDSFLSRLGSNNFSSLIESPNLHHLENENVPQQHLQQQQQTQVHQQNLHQQELSDQYLHIPGINDTLFIENGILTLPQSELHFDSAEEWKNLEIEVENESSPLKPEAHVGVVDGNSSSSIPYIPDSTAAPVVPSLTPWPGQYNFDISLPIENRDRNKWCFSAEQNKLYLCPYVAVPINVKLLQFINASITITPVFKESRHRVEPVLPCFNCKSKVRSDFKDHIVMMEGQECDYKEVNGRYVVSMPLYPPPPGEAASTLLLKLNCLTSCVGGANRRPYCLVFTLHDGLGNNIGRQILDLKCCKCPGRDMLNEDKALLLRNQERSSQNRLPKDHTQALKRTTPVTGSGEKKRRIIIKPEPQTERQCENVKVPVEYVRLVKKYINELDSHDYMRRNFPGQLFFSEDEL